jgi:hypothetical protein
MPQHIVQVAGDSLPFRHFGKMLYLFIRHPQLRVRPLLPRDRKIADRHDEPEKHSRDPAPPVQVKKVSLQHDEQGTARQNRKDERGRVENERQIRRRVDQNAAGALVNRHVARAQHEHRKRNQQTLSYSGTVRQRRRIDHIKAEINRQE